MICIRGCGRVVPGNSKNVGFFLDVNVYALCCCGPKNRLQVKTAQAESE
jgi:hypothetical protein